MADLLPQTHEKILEDILEKERREKEERQNGYESLCQMFPNLSEDIVQLVYNSASYEADVATERLLTLSEIESGAARNNELATILRAMGIPVPPESIGESDDQRLAAMLQVYYARLECKIIRRRKPHQQPPSLGPNEQLPLSMALGGGHDGGEAPLGAALGGGEEGAGRGGAGGGGEGFRDGRGAGLFQGYRARGEGGEGLFEGYEAGGGEGGERKALCDRQEDVFESFVGDEEGSMRGGEAGGMPRHRRNNNVVDV